MLSKLRPLRKKVWQNLHRQHHGRPLGPLLMPVWAGLEACCPQEGPRQTLIAAMLTASLHSRALALPAEPFMFALD